MPGRILIQQAFLFATLSIFSTISAAADTCSADFKVVSGSDFEMQFASSFGPPVRIDIKGSSGSGARPAITPAIAKVPALFKIEYPDMDLGSEKFAIARGGQATVFIPTDGKHVVRVVPQADLKANQEKLAVERDMGKRLRKAGLAGRFAIPLHETEIQVDGFTFYAQAFEKYDGSLSDFYKTDKYQKMTYEQKLHLANDLAQSVRLMHEAGLFHYDLKSDNILYRLKSNGDVQLAIADLGLMRDPKTVSAEGATRGTPFYISPTALAGNGKDPRSDVYPLGVVFQELMTGHLVREAAKSEQAKPKGPTIAGSASDTAIFNWLVNATTSSPFQYHTADGFRAIPNQTRIAFPYVEDTVSAIDRTERAAQQNFAVLAWYPFRNATEMSAATAEATRNPKGFKDWFLGQLFSEKPGDKSSYQWNSNGGHIVQAVLSNDVFAAWMIENVEKMPANARAYMLTELKLVHQAVSVAEKQPGPGEATAGSYRVEFKDSSSLPHLRLYLTDQEMSLNLWFGRFLNGHTLETMMARLEAANR